MAVEDAEQQKDGGRRVVPFEDLYTEAEAVQFLKLSTPRMLRTLREQHGLTGKRFGKRYLYHRQHLVAVAERVFGVNQLTPAGSRGQGYGGGRGRRTA